MFTFFTTAKYPEAKIAYSLAGDHLLKLHYSKHNSYNSAQVYIEPNMTLSWLPATFMSVAQYPWARIEHGTGRWPNTRAGDNSLGSYYRKHGAYNGAMVYIKPNDDSEPVDVILNHRGSMVMMQFRPWSRSSSALGFDRCI